MSFQSPGFTIKRGFNLIFGDLGKLEKPLLWNPFSAYPVGMWNFSADNTIANGGLPALGSPYAAYADLYSQNSGKRYFEILVIHSEAYANNVPNDYGFINSTVNPTISDQGVVIRRAGDIYVNSIVVATGSAFGDGTVLGFAVDFNNLKFWIGINNVWVGGGNPSIGTGQTGNFPANSYFPAANGSSNGTVGVIAKLAGRASEFTFSPPSGFIDWQA